MANTTNLNLEEIELTDTIRDGFVNKINANQEKIDNAYGVLVDNLMEHTSASNLEEAIENLQDINTLQEEVNELKSVGNATASQILNGKTALVQGETVTGTALATATTASTNSVASGKTYYDNTGTLRTGTANFTSTTATASDVVSGKTFLTSNGSTLTRTTGTGSISQSVYTDVTSKTQTISFTFANKPSRFIFFADCFDTGNTSLSYNTESNIISGDTRIYGINGASIAITTVKSDGRTYYVYSNNGSCLLSWSGNTATLTTSSSRYFGAYSGTLRYYAIGI